VEKQDQAPRCKDCSGQHEPAHWSKANERLLVHRLRLRDRRMIQIFSPALGNETAQKLVIQQEEAQAQYKIVQEGVVCSDDDANLEWSENAEADNLPSPGQKQHEHQAKLGNQRQKSRGCVEPVRQVLHVVAHPGWKRPTREGGFRAPNLGRNPAEAKKSEMKPASSSIPSDWYEAKSCAAAMKERKHTKQINKAPRGHRFTTTEATNPSQQISISMWLLDENHRRVGANQKR